MHPRAEGALLEKASAELKAKIAERGSFEQGMKDALTSQCRKENAKAFGDGDKLPPTGVAPPSTHARTHARTMSLYTLMTL